MAGKGGHAVWGYVNVNSKVLSMPDKYDRFKQHGPQLDSEQARVFDAHKKKSKAENIRAERERQRENLLRLLNAPLKPC